jgi:hypothetical protein
MTDLIKLVEKWEREIGTGTHARTLQGIIEGLRESVANKTKALCCVELRAALADYDAIVSRLAKAEAKLQEHEIEWEEGKGYVFTPKERDISRQ